MAQLEGIIRPFQSGDVFTARVLPPAQPAVTAPAPVTVSYGSPITLQCKPIGVSTLFGGVKLKEVSRRTSTVRVKNPDDESQFVDVQRIDYLKLQDQVSQQIHEWTFNNGATG